jgi:hypothetical protein
MGLGFGFERHVLDGLYAIWVVPAIKVNSGFAVRHGKDLFRDGGVMTSEDGVATLVGGKLGFCFSRYPWLADLEGRLGDHTIRFIRASR